MKNLLILSFFFFFSGILLFGFSGDAHAASCTGAATGRSGACVASSDGCASPNSVDGTCTGDPGNPVCCVFPASGGGSCGSDGTCATSCTNGTITGTCTAPLQCCAPDSGGGASGGSGDDVINLNNPTKFGTVEGLISSVLRSLQGVIITLALIFLVVGAILYLTSGGSEDRITLGKKALIAALIGFAIAIGAPSFLHEISVTLDWNAADDPSSVCDADRSGSIESSEQDCVSELEALNKKPRLAKILINVLSFLLGAFGTLAVIIFVVAGIRYLFSAGSEAQTDNAKRMVTWAIVGIIVAFGALVIVRQIAKFFLGG